MQEEQLDTNIPEVDIANIFINRNDGASDEEEAPQEEKVDEGGTPEEEEQKDENSSTETNKEHEKPVEEEKKEPSIDYEAELEKAERRYKDSQKWGTEMRKKLAAYEKAIKKHTEAGALTSEEAEELLDHTKFEDAPTEDESLFIKYSRIWDEGVERMREFADDPKEIDKYVHAFQQLLRDSTSSEQEEILDQFTEVEGNKASMTRKMIKLGKDYYDETFGEVYESGSIRNFKKKFADKEKKYNKEIDNLKNEVDKLKSKYEDYTEPTRLPAGGSDKSIDTKRYTTDVKEIYSNR